MDQYDDKILDHHYDGIQEYDNPMPGWWKAIFALTVVWAAIYFVGIELNMLPRYGDDLKADQRELLAIRQAHEAAQPPIIITDEMLLASIADPVQVLRGSKLFAQTCSSCHGKVGEGAIGPNLTDDYWLHGHQPMNMLTIIKKGNANGMPPWEAVFPPEDLLALVAYVASLRGTHPAHAKPPQGDRFAPPGTPSEDDAE